MNNKDILKEILNDSSINYSKEDLELILENELEKSYSERDYDLIHELTDTLIIMENQEIDIDIDNNINEIINEHHSKKSRFQKFLRIPVAASLILVALFAVNIISISAFNINLFGEIVEFGEEIVKFDFNGPKSNTIELEISNKDPYGLKGEMKKIGMSAMIPNYIPEGFELENLETDGIEENSYDYLLLNYKNKREILNIDITEFKDQISKNIGIPSDKGNLEEIKINGISIFILSEDGWYKSIFSKDLVVYNVSTNLDYGALIKILESFE